MHQYPVIASAILYFVGINGLNDKYWPQFYPYLNEFDSNKALGSPSYKQKQKWDHYFFGEMTVSVEEYVTESITKKNQDGSTIASCQRVTVFSVRGLLLNGLTLTTECKPDKRLEQILYIDGALWNYPHFKIKIDSSGRNAIVLKLIKEKKRTGPEQIETVSFCDMTIYELERLSTVARPHKTVRVPLDGEEDQDCKSLKGESGAFSFKRINSPDRLQDDGVMNININQLGVQLYSYLTPFCHHMVLTFMGGFPMTGTAKFCSTSIGNVVVTDEAVYYGSDIMVRLSPSDPGLATTVLNNRDGTCTHRQYRVGSKEHMDQGYSTLQSVTVMHEPDQECTDFIEGKLVKEMGKTDMEKVMSEFTDNKVKVVPLGVRFEVGPKSYKFSSKSSEYVLRVSNGNDLDIILLSAGTIIGGRVINYWLVFLAKGAIIDIMAIQRVPNFLVTKNSIVCERFAMIERYEDNEMYSVLSHWDSVFCTRTRFTLANKDGRLVKQNLFPSEIGVYDEKCKSLMTRMKSNKKYNWGMQDGATILGYTKDEFPDLQEYLS